MEVHVKETSLIQPANPTPLEKLRLTNLDVLVARTHSLTIYIYKPNGDQQNFFDSQVLKDALSNVLFSFYPMAGRLGRDENGKIEINCNGEGVLFVEAEIDSAIDELGEFTPSSEMRKMLIPAIDYSGDISSYALVVLQVTRFKCGGVTLGIGIHHTLCDGLSALHFINTWSNMTRGLSIAIPPFINRTLLCARTPPSPTFEHVEYHTPPILQTTSKQIPGAKAKPTAILKITLEQLNLLKTKSKYEGTTYEILAAHIWRCTCKTWGLADDQLTKLHIVTDGRSRLCPSLPPGYLGNAIFITATITQSGDLQSESLTDSAKRIHNAVIRADDEYLRSALDYLYLQPDLSALVRGPGYLASPNLKIVSWANLPLYNADFGWGRPLFVGPACILYEGTSYILPSPTKDRSLFLGVCFDDDHMTIFKKLLYSF